MKLVPSRLASPFRQFGFGAGLLYVIDRALQRLSPNWRLYVYEFMAQPITEKPLLSANLAKNLEFRLIERGDPDIASMPAHEDIKQARFDQGAVCLGTYRRGRLIGYIWLCFDAYEEDEVRCTYRLVQPEQSVFDFDLVVLPEHRMGIGFMAVWHGANQYLHERGVRYTFSRLTRFNVASRRAHQHLGWQCVARAVFLQAGRAELMCATRAPFVSLSLSRQQRATLDLGPPRPSPSTKQPQPARGRTAEEGMN